MVGTLTNQILWVYTGLSGSMQGTFFKGWWKKNQDFMLIRLFNPSNLISCAGDINQSDSVGLHGFMQVYVKILNWFL